jgi:hypothetical protein
MQSITPASVWFVRQIEQRCQDGQFNVAFDTGMNINHNCHLSAPTQVGPFKCFLLKARLEFIHLGAALALIHAAMMADELLAYVYEKARKRIDVLQPKMTFRN